MGIIIVSFIIVFIVLTATIITLCRKDKTSPAAQFVIPSHNLEKRIADLEAPFKFEIGDRVEYCGQFIHNKKIFGIIVDCNLKYQNHYRINTYKIYVESMKFSDDVEEVRLRKTKSK